MKKTLLKFVTASLTTLLMLAWPTIAKAQYPAGLRAPPTPVDPATGLPSAPPEIIEFDELSHNKKINLNLDGIPLLEVIEMLRKEFTNVNFIVTPGIREQEPPLIFLKLRSASLREILTGIYFATGKQIEYEVQSPALLAFVSTKEKPAEGLAGPAPTPPPSALKPPTPPKYQILNLREALRVKDQAKIDEILKTVSEITKNTLYEMHHSEFGNNPDQQLAQLMPRLNYHAGSGVLVMVGQMESLELVNQVIRNLRVREEPPSSAPENPFRKPASPGEPAVPNQGK